MTSYTNQNYTQVMNILRELHIGEGVEINGKQASRDSKGFIIDDRRAANVRAAAKLVMS
jgi:uncharacterized protein (UPF0147 family)